MKKFFYLIIIVIIFTSRSGFAQFASDGSYLWNSTSISYSPDTKTEIVLANKDHYSNQINHMDYYHFDLAAYRLITRTFSVGLGIRQSESFKATSWNPGNAYFLYGVLSFNPGPIKIKFSNRIALRTSRNAETLYTFDNNTVVDFFVKSVNRIPKPFLQDEIFTNLNQGKIQTVRYYGGFHILKVTHFALDLYYCYQKTRPSWVWKYYDTFGLSAKFKI